MTTHRPMVIIGSGPAGLTAALYAGRAKLNPLVLEGPQPGGLLTTTTRVENFPGHENGIDGPELTAVLRRQAERYGADCRYETVTKLDVTQRPFRIVSDKGEYTADSVILSTGSSPKALGLHGERELMGRGVSTCATCDGPLYQDKTVAVVGGGDSAMTEADFLSRFAKRVHVFVRGASLKASQIMQDRVRANPKITIHPETVVSKLEGTAQSGLTGLSVTDLRSGKRQAVSADGLFVAIGHKPNTGFLSHSDTSIVRIARDAEGYVVVKPGDTRTSVPGVYAAGDIQDKTFRQAVTAAASGCMAAMTAERDLAALKPRFGKARDVSAPDLERLLKTEKRPVVVDFWAPWCPPCRLMAPIVDAMATQYKDRALVTKLNADKHPEVMKQHNVRGLPTLMCFQDGKPTGSPLVGAVDDATLRAWLDAVLSRRS